MKTRFFLLVDSISTLFKKMPIQCTFLITAITIQGTMPALSIKVSGYIADMISQSFQASNMLLLCMLWATSLLLYDLINPWILFLQGNISDKMVFHINHEIIKKSNSIEGLNIFEDPSFHDNIQVLQSQASHKPLNLVVTLVGLAKDLVMIVSCTTLLFTQINAICFAIILSAYIHFRTSSTIQSRTWEESLGRSPKSRFTNYLSSLSVSPSSAKEIRFFNLGHYLLQEYKKTFEETYRNIFRLRLKQAFLPILPFLFSASINLIAFCFVASKVSQGMLHFGSFLILLQALTQLHLSVSSFGEQSGWLSGHLLFFEKYFNFLLTPEKIFNNEIKIKDEHDNIINKLTHIEFKNVSFSYSNGISILKDINFTISANEKIAIIGLNGAGKTTLIKLLCGFYPPTKGEILINGIALKNIDINLWRSKISPVFQDFSKYFFSLKHNITMGASTSSHSMLDNILEECHLNEVTSALEKDLDRPLGSSFGGPDLSGGQWQKVAIARAVYKKSLLYILDEPTAALDPITEYEIFRLFKKISKDKMTLFITHRLGSITMADRILVLENGCLTGNNTHDELMKTHALYKKMFLTQSQYYQKEYKRENVLP